MNQIRLKTEGNYADYRMCVCLGNSIRNALDVCKEKLVFENSSMVIRRALLDYFKKHLSKEEYENVIGGS